jgi:hypothetical protein
MTLCKFYRLALACIDHFSNQTLAILPAWFKLTFKETSIQVLFFLLLHFIFRASYILVPVDLR